MHISFPPIFYLQELLLYLMVNYQRLIDLIKGNVSRETLDKFPIEKSIVAFICEFSYLFLLIFLKNYLLLFYFVICKYIFIFNFN